MLPIIWAMLSKSGNMSGDELPCCNGILKREVAMTDTKELKSQLEQRLIALEARVANLESDLRTAHSQDWEERASEISGDEVLEGLESSAMDEITQIRSVLKRIDDDSYGDCGGCGKEIGAKRLAALPFAVLCIHCANRAAS